LDALKLETLEFHWAESEPNTGGENNAIVVTARGQPFEQGILLDSWRAQPHVTWTQVTKDPGYHWNENKSFAARVLRKSK
jgi:chemotaxis signal transduction protein